MIQDFELTLELLKGARGGDTSCRAVLVERYGEVLLNRIRLMLGPEARRLAQSGDFLQTVFVELLVGLERAELRDEGAFLRWAVQIARNNIRDSVRRSREQLFSEFAHSTVVANFVDDRAVGPPSAAFGREAVDRLVEALERLALEQQTVIELRDFEQLSFKEVARRMERTENAVQLLHTRAKLKLGALLTRDSEG